ncbi:MAG: SDR family oxidoreductase [Lachnospiraceae bacterium]|nr:SDR family oxidoreductase [Lachnospiraceae bacterium]
MMMDFTGKVFIVTGASSGIGLSCAEQIIALGGHVIGVDKNATAVDNDAYGHSVISVTDERAIKNLVNTVTDKYGHIDGLVNAAGIWGSSKPFYEMDSEAFQNVFDVNTKGMFLMSKYVSRAMIPQKRGKIVNISCIRASVFRNNMADYAASKGAVVSMTSAMALDLAPYNIQVNSVAPGFTYTGMTSASFDNPEVREQSEKLIPNGRLGIPKDISSVVMFLLSDMSDYMTGTNVFADGGYHIQK